MWLLDVWVKMGCVGRSEAHGSHAELWGQEKYALPPLPLSFSPSVSLPGCIIHTVSGKSLFREKPWEQALNCHGDHGWGCPASTQNWPFSRTDNGIVLCK